MTDPGPPAAGGTADPAPRGRAALADGLVASLRERIIQWRYLPGHRLTEDGLCREFGVSRSPVREALKTLTANGFVERLPRRGYAVRQLDLTGVEELYQVRLALELFVVERLAARPAPGDGLDRLRADWTALLDAGAPSSETLARLDERFHEGLARALGNETLLGQLRAINERLLVFRTIDFESAERIGQTCHQHLAVLERIAAGDGPGARTAIERNIMDGCDTVETVLAGALARYCLGRPRGAGAPERA